MSEKPEEQPVQVRSSTDEKPEQETSSTRPTSNVASKETVVDPVDQASKLENIDEEAIVYPTGAKLALISLGLCLATFVVALDNTIIATAIPTITSVFNSLNDVGWYGSSYLLTLTSLQPSFGKIYANFDVKYTYLGALVVFEGMPLSYL
jgi:hypothetical protein